MDFVFIGAGNLATNLATAFYEQGYVIKQVYSRTRESASELADKIETDFTTRIDQIDPDADLYVVALKDDAIEEVISRLSFEPKMIVHTAGSVPMALLSKYFSQYGVFYPLQTFSKQKVVDFSEIPLCIEASTKETHQVLEKIAKNISREVYNLDSEQRLYLHVAAVFACNFTNFMYAGAEEILKKHDIPFQILIPLIRETFEKITIHSPSEVQTGPAIRNDEETMQKHLNFLSDSDLFQNLYSFVSKAIIKYYKNT
jgi:predicted short-subunit dehydrogenase-like oxidoreductase (DUF2520 family)